MLSRIDIRSTVASLSLTVALVFSAVAVLAPAANAELAPPPLPGAEELPAPTTTEGVPPTGSAPEVNEEEGAKAAPASAVVPKVESQAARIVHARVAGQGLMLSLQCSTGGTVELPRGASRHFRCSNGKGSAVLHLSAKQRRLSAGPHGLKIAVVVQMESSTTKVPLIVHSSSARPSAASASASTSPSYWNEVSSSCVSYGPQRGGYVYVQTSNFNGFGGAAPGEAVYWQSYLYAYEGGAWHRYGAGWSNYTASSSAEGGGGNGEMTIGGGGYQYSVSQAFTIPPRTWTITGVYVWTKRTGYHFAWVNNEGNGYGDVYSHSGFCYTS